MIGGNIKGLLQRANVSVNEIGESIEEWVNVKTLTGWLDYTGGSSEYQKYNKKTEETTHIFICDYVKSVEGDRMIIDGKNYDVLLIDNPMNMNRQLEIYLKCVEG